VPALPPQKKMWVPGYRQAHGGLKKKPGTSTLIFFILLNLLFIFGSAHGLQHSASAALFPSGPFRHMLRAIRGPAALGHRIMGRGPPRFSSSAAADATSAAELFTALQAGDQGLPKATGFFGKDCPARDRRALGRALTLVESRLPAHRHTADALLALALQQPRAQAALRVGISGPPGAGKSARGLRSGTCLP
jgi:hypothetical protein